MPAYTKASYNLVASLTARCAWLLQTRRKIGLDALLSLCRDDQDIHLICDLLEHFHFIDTDGLSNALHSIVEYIHADLNLDPATVQYVSCHTGDDPDSSQLIVQYLKPVLADKGIFTARVVNNMAAAVSRLSHKPHIVLVDEFLGTGNTMIDKLTKARTLYAAGGSGLQLHVCMVAAMQFGIDAVAAKCLADSVFSVVTLRKGLSERLTGDTLKAAMDRMLGLESLLAVRANGRRLPSLGYGRSETLYALNGGNIPNNVFPIFLWKWLSDGTARDTLFCRL